MSFVPKLNLSAAVKVHVNDTINDVVEDQSVDGSEKSFHNENSSDSKQCDKLPVKTSPLSLLDSQYLEDVDENGFKEPPCLINNELDFRVELTEQDEQYMDFNSSQQDDNFNDSSNNENSQCASDNDAASETSVQSYSLLNNNDSFMPNVYNAHMAGYKSPSQMSNVSARKRRRTVNKLDQDPEKIPLRDLLFYNPPETIFQKETKLQDCEIENMLTNRPRRSSRSNSVNSEQQQKPEEIEPKKDDENSNLNEEPLLTIDESGNVVLKNPNIGTESKEKKTDVKVKSSTTYNSFRRRERSKNIWNNEETSIFYTALEIVGTDFSLMEAVFFKDKGRDRKQLKQKFKREEKINRAYIDKILYKSLTNQVKSGAK